MTTSPDAVHLTGAPAYQLTDIVDELNVKRQWYEPVWTAQGALELAIAILHRRLLPHALQDGTTPLTTDTKTERTLQ